MARKIDIASILSDKRSYKETRFLSDKGSSRFCYYHSPPICIGSQIQSTIKALTDTNRIFLVPPYFRNTSYEKETICPKEFGKIFFDLRDGRMRNLEIKKQNCFNQDLSLWNQITQISSSLEIPREQNNLLNNSAVYCLSQQKRILHIVAARNT